MKIVVIGGTGLIGSKLVEKLRQDGQEPLAASPDSGVNALTGEGLAEALAGRPGRRRRGERTRLGRRGRARLLPDRIPQPARRRDGRRRGAPRHVVGRRRGPARCRERLHAREGRAGGVGQGRARPLHDRPRNAVLRVHRPDRRFGHRRRHRSAVARPRSARSGRRRRRHPGRCRGRRTTERHGRAGRPGSRSDSTSSPGVS